MVKQTGNQIPSPEEHLGYKVGSDRNLADWPEIVEYFWMLDRNSDRVKVQEMGPSTEGNPMLLATIASEETISNLDKYRDIQHRLADPRSITSDDEAKDLIAEGKSVILVTCSVHATEVGATQMSLLLAHHLATNNDQATKDILDNVIFLLIPCLNPDGLRLVKSWYESTLGTWYEGVNQPFLYHKYVGHDNNRDWFMFTQNETKLTVEHAHNRWHPQVVYDLHQMGPYGPRLFVPPYMDPIDPNVDPILQAEIAMLGTAMFSELTGQGKEGVAVHCIYDAYSPSRAYQHYHGAIRILSEAASCRIATPIEISAEEITYSRGLNPREQTWNNPMPWKGGTWSLKDIVDYDFGAVMAALGNLARYRDIWLRNFLEVGKRAITGENRPFAYVIPMKQRDPITAFELIQTMETAMVEVHEAQQEFTADGIVHAAGTRVILMNQPYASFAKTMLETQVYPDLRLYPGGPPKPPYDATAHGLPAQMGVKVVEVQEPFEAPLNLIKEFSPPKGRIEGTSEGSTTFVLGAETNASFWAVNKLLDADIHVSRALKPFKTDRGTQEIGTYIIEGPQIGNIVKKLANQSGLAFEAVKSPILAERMFLRSPRVGLYKSWSPTAEEGWSRWIFEEYSLPYKSLFDADIKQGNLGASYDAIVLPHQPAKRILEGQSRSEYPPEFAGGLGMLGAENLRSFAEGGGTIIAWDGAAEFAMKYLDLPVRNILGDLPDAEFYAPGTFFSVLLDVTHPIAHGLPRRVSVMFERSPAFVADEGALIGRYPRSNPLVSGWVLGQHHLQGKASLVEIPLGLGRVILIGFKVNFRAQARGTYRLLFNSILYSSATFGENFPINLSAE